MVVFVLLWLPSPPTKPCRRHSISFLIYLRSHWRRFSVVFTPLPLCRGSHARSRSVCGMSLLLKLNHFILGFFWSDCTDGILVVFQTKNHDKIAPIALYEKRFLRLLHFTCVCVANATAVRYRCRRHHHLHQPTPLKPTCNQVWQSTSIWH